MPSTADNAFLVTGDDEPVIRSEADRIVRRLAGENPDPFALDVFCEQDGLDVSELLRQVIFSLRTPPFLSGRKTVWLQHFGKFSSEGNASSKSADARAFRDLAELVKAGLPEDMALVIDGPKADGKKALSLAFKKHANLIVCSRPKTSDRNWQVAMAGLVEQKAKDKGIRLPAEVCQYLVGVVGTDTAAIDCELEKLVCFCGGPDQPITLAAAEEICVGQGEEISWALTDALGKRDANEALRVINVLVSQTQGDPDKAARSLLGQVANFYRYLLQMRLLFHTCKTNARSVRALLNSMSETERETLVGDGLEVAGMNPYRAQMLAEGATRYDGPDLVEAVCAMRDAYLRCITTGVPVRTLLEELVLRFTAKNRR